MKSIGFSTIYYNSLTAFDKKFIDGTFELFDISANQLGIVPTSKTLSVQSIFFGKDIANMSLVNDHESFERLYALFKDIVDILSSEGYESLIFGSPNLRKAKDISSVHTFDVDKRAKLLYDYALDNKMKLYFEALPLTMCDYINDHTELLNLSDKFFNKSAIHIDFATMIANAEDLDFLQRNIDLIERYHISVPGYSYNFRDFHFIKDWIAYLSLNNKIGVIEIQNAIENKEIVEEIEWLIEKI